MIGRSGMRPWLSSCPWDGGRPRFYDAVGYTAKEFWLCVLGVAYAENNGIPLVALHSLQILDEERLLAVGFGAVIEGPVHVVIVHADPGAVGLDRREGDEIVVVEILIGEGNELFIAAAIMPFQADLGNVVEQMSGMDSKSVTSPLSSSVSSTSTVVLKKLLGGI